MYRLLLKLLSRQRRERFGAEMAGVFDDQRRQTKGRAGRIRLWVNEVVGLVRFGLRDRWMRRSPTSLHPRRQHRWSSAELRWAWRRVRARGGRAGFIVLLLATAIAANTVVFSAADALVFARTPYPYADRLVALEREAGSLGVVDYQSPGAIREWRRHGDLFIAVHGHERAAPAFLTTNGITEAVRGQQVTPGLFESLGVAPAVGRLFRADDAESAQPVAILSDGLARRIFRDAAAAVGSTFVIGSERATVIGVMPAGFRFPSAREEFWRPLDFARWPERIGLRVVAQVAPGRAIEDVVRGVEARRTDVALAAGRPARERTSARPLAEAWGQTRPTALFALLSGAALCLLLIACGNVASLELASAAGRSRTLAVQAALGASRASLVRGALLEGAVMLGAVAALALAVSAWTVGAVSRALLPAVRDTLVNAIDLDLRTLIAMGALTVVAWFFTSLPGLVRALRPDLMHTLRDDARTMPVGRGATTLRQALMAGQVALTVLLLVGSLLFIRAYVHRAGIDKGFDVAGLVSVTVGATPDAPLQDADLEAAVLDRIRSFPGVRQVARTYSIPPSTTAGISGQFHIWGRESPGDIKLAGYSVEPEYFETMRIPIVQGRLFSNRPDEIVVDDALARRYWPDGGALGARIKVGGPRGFADSGGAGWGGVTEFEIVGITSRLRADSTQTPAGADVFIVYVRLRPDSTTQTFVVRLADERQIPALAQAVRAAAERSIVRIETLAARYAALDQHSRLAATITSSFGLVALVVATAGVFAVMTFLVAGRTREIGIRLALGASPAVLRRLVFGSSITFVGAGALAGLAASAATARWIEQQLDGLAAIDPVTYAAVTALVLLSALAATWAPARAAMRVDPAITLRSQ